VNNPAVSRQIATRHGRFAIIRNENAPRGIELPPRSELHFNGPIPGLGRYAYRRHHPASF